MAALRMLAICALLFAGVAAVQSQCVCSNGASCIAGTSTCNCSTVPYTTGTYCNNCFPNRDRTTGCTTVLNPCINCPTADPEDCTDVAGLCAVDGRCTSVVPGTYKCACGGGFNFIMPNSTYPLGICVDKNECTMKRICPTYADCHNFKGGYKCTCRPGYKSLYDSTGLKLRFCTKIKA